eukprot:TRINITY_DN2844_c0_g1_i1.p1 TRINITY_DN2844_c0_g1~~TRINITY_DN2844_c0_g1_i1.p1  ORF type:complete len:568 (-),score=85.22 TRINITY_DN2844_c0_g1_i1:13-1716(-)
MTTADLQERIQYEPLLSAESAKEREGYDQQSYLDHTHHDEEDEDTNEYEGYEPNANGIKGCSDGWYFGRLCRSISNEREEIVAMLSLAGPVIFSFLMSFLQFFINLVFVGHLPNVEGDEHAPEFPAAAFGTTFVNVTGFSVISGMLSAVDTLCSQAYGAKNYKKVGFVVQRGILIYTVACIPVGILWFFSDRIFALVISNPEVARLTGLYVKMMIPGLWFAFLFETLKRWLEAMSIVKPIMYISILSVPVCVGFECLNIFVFKLGFEGCPLAMSMTYVVSCLMMVGYIVFSGIHKETWSGWSKEALTGWSEYLKLAVPGAMMLCAEWWGFEITIIIAGRLDDTGVSIAAQSIGFNTLGWCFMVPLGLAIAVSTRVGNFLGANKPEAAKKSATVAIGLEVVFQFTAMVLFVSIRRQWSEVYDNDPDVVALASKVIGIAGFVTFFDGMQGVFSGILRGCAKQKVGAALNIIAYYIISLPIGVPLAFLTSLRIFGLWVGLFSGISFMATGALTYIVKMDWVEAAREAVAANAEENESSNNSVELSYISHSEKDNLPNTSRLSEFEDNEEQ